jgi:CelD/BcsL family acetyltransferase involved in cellulose biosynthesis
MRPAWVGAWWNAFGKGEPLFLAARRDGALCGVLPLEREGRMLRGMTNDHAVELALLAADEEADRALAGGLFDRLGDRATLELIDPSLPGVAGLRAEARSEHRVGVRVFRRAPYVTLDGTFEDYQRRLPGHLRADLGRRLRRLEERGAVKFEIGLAEADRVPALLEEGCALEAGGWKGAEGTAVSSHEDTLHFYREAGAWAAKEGLLHLAFLRLDGQAIAFEYAIRDARSHYRLKIGFDASFSAFAPGKLLLRALIADAFERGLERFELLGNADPYKLEWSTGLRDLVTVEAFGRTARGRGSHLRDGVVRPLGRRALVIAGRRR